MRRIFFMFIVLAIINSSCSTSSDVVSDKRLQKRKYTKGLSIKKAPLSLKTLSHISLDQANKNKSESINENYNFDYILKNVVISNSLSIEKKTLLTANLNNITVDDCCSCAPGCC